MRILVYGAGVIGANLAADLFVSGKDVTLLTRGPWADTLERDGLTVKPAFSLRKRTYHIPIIRELKSYDAYDVIFVVMRFTQYPTYRKLEADAKEHLKG
jgi:2-dehydropantoate 2-reductase